MGQRMCADGRMKDRGTHDSVGDGLELAVDLHVVARLDEVCVPGLQLFDHPYDQDRIVSLDVSAFISQSIRTWDLRLWQPARWRECVAGARWESLGVGISAPGAELRVRISPERADN